MQINRSMCLSCLLLASTNALSHARSVSMDGTANEALFNVEEAFSRPALSQNITLTSNGSNSTQKKRTSKIRINVSYKNTC